MKKNTHPNYYYDAKVTCACGNTWTTGSIKKEIRTEVCSACHPFFTGQQQRLLDMEGQVDRFYRRLQARQEFLSEKQAREDAKIASAESLETLELSKRAVEALKSAGLETVTAVYAKYQEIHDDGMLSIEGFGQKSLVDLKKKLRSLGYEIAEAE